MEAYEYTVYECVWEVGRREDQTKIHLKKLNDLGAEGWKLKSSVGPIGTSGQCRYIFMRLVGSGKGSASTLTEAK